MRSCTSDVENYLARNSQLSIYYMCCPSEVNSHKDFKPCISPLTVTITKSELKSGALSRLVAKLSLNIFCYPGFVLYNDILMSACTVCIETVFLKAFKCRI